MSSAAENAILDPSPPSLSSPKVEEGGGGGGGGRGGGGGAKVAAKKKKKKAKKAKSTYPAPWRWLESLPPLLRVRALATRDEVATTVIINLANDQNHSSVTQRIMDIESFRMFTKEVGTNIVGSKRMRSTKKAKCYYVRSQHRLFNVKMKVDPKVMHRSMAFHNSGSAKAVKEVKLRKQSVEMLSVMPWEEGRAKGGGGFGGGSNGRNGKGGSNKELDNMVNAVTASFAAVGKLDHLWSRLREFSDGRFLENPEAELAGLRTETQWYTKWFRDLPRFSFQQLVAALLEFALLRSFDKWRKKNGIDAGEVKGGGGGDGGFKHGLSIFSGTFGNNHTSPGYEVKALSDGSSPLLEKVRRLADYWSGVSLEARMKHLKDAQNKVGNGYLSKSASGTKGSERNHGGSAGGGAGGKTSKRPPSHDEKRKILEFFLTRTSLVRDESEGWTIDRYSCFFWDLMATPLPDCSLPEHTLTCRKAIIYEIDVKRSEAQTRNLLFFMSDDEDYDTSKTKNRKSKKNKKKKNSKKTAAQGGPNLGGGNDQRDDEENVTTGASGASSGPNGSPHADAPEFKDTREETPQQKKTRKAREKRKRQKEKRARRDAERKREEAKRQAIEDARKEVKHREKMVRRCVEQLIRDVESLREEEIKEEKKRQHRENERRKRKRKEAAAREQKERDAVSIMCRRVLVEEIISKHVFQRVDDLEESRRPVIDRCEEERRRRVTEEENLRRMTRDERRLNQERAARDLDAEKARRVAEWENVTNNRHGEASRIAQQELVMRMTEQERERRVREHVVATRTSLDERGRNAVKANEMMDQEQLRLISDYRKAQEKRLVEENRSMMLKLLKEGGTQGGVGRVSREGGRMIGGGGRGKGGGSTRGVAVRMSRGSNSMHAAAAPRTLSSSAAAAAATAASTTTTAQNAAGREKYEKKWQGWSVEANDKKVQELHRKARKERVPGMTPPRSSSGTPISSAQSSPQGNGIMSPSSMSVTGSDHATHSKDNREGMYRRGVVRMQAVSAAVETLEKFAKLTRVGRSLTKARGASSGELDAGVSGVGSSPATPSKHVDNANSSAVPQLSDLIDQWPEAFCVVYGARAINSYMDGGSSPRRLHTEDLDVQVFLGKDATPEQFFEFCRRLAVNMTWLLEGRTQRLRQEWAEQAKKVEQALKGNGKSKGKANGGDRSMDIIATQNNDLSPSQRRELEIEYEVATDRGQSFGSFPWWRGQTTSFTMQMPSSVTYPGDDLPGSVVHGSLPEGNFAQYRSVLQPHDVTHAKWAVLGPVVDFTWLRIAPSSDTVKIRPLAVIQARVDRSTQPVEAVFNVPTRSLRWLDRANLLTLRGKSLENEWRRSKDAHRRQYMARLQHRGDLTMVVRRRDGSEEGGPEEEEEAAPNVDGRKSRVFVADWSEFPCGANNSNPAQQPQPQRSVTEMTKEELAEEVQALRVRLLC